MLEGAKSIGAGAATIASAGAAVGIGNVFSSSIHSVARNPSLAKQLFGYAILGFALTEAIALFALMMAFLISFVFRSKEHKIWPSNSLGSSRGRGRGWVAPFLVSCDFLFHSMIGVEGSGEEGPFHQITLLSFIQKQYRNWFYKRGRELHRSDTCLLRSGR
nr:ATPase subunit 9 [Mammillaria huitzilopochtli]WBU13177.1 ATPase subunit 9 [Mammillaria huitzilopochtli]